jgi:zinc transport system ATP-binding protein
MNMKTEMIVLKDVCVYYNDITVLEDVNLTLEQHDFLGIIGPNGGGKSTLLKVILGLVKPGKGTIKICGDTPKKSRKYIGYVPQYSLFDLDFPMSVWDVVLMGRLGHAGLFKKFSNNDKKMALDALMTVDMLEYRNHQIGSLSGGQRQRVFIARALAANPRLLLLDEPAAGIDTVMQTEFYELLEKLNRNKMTIIMVSHDISAVSIHVDKIACLNHKLFYHDSKELTVEDLEATYQCPVELIAHGVPHRVLKNH